MVPRVVAVRSRWSPTEPRPCRSCCVGRFAVLLRRERADTQVGARPRSYALTGGSTGSTPSPRHGRTSSPRAPSAGALGPTSPYTPTSYKRRSVASWAPASTSGRAFVLPIRLLASGRCHSAPRPRAAGDGRLRSTSAPPPKMGVEAFDEAGVQEGVRLSTSSRASRSLAHACSLALSSSPAQCRSSKVGRSRSRSPKHEGWDRGSWLARTFRLSA